MAGSAALFVTYREQGRTGLIERSGYVGEIDYHGRVWIEGNTPSRPIQTPFRVKRQADRRWYREDDGEASIAISP